MTSSHYHVFLCPCIAGAGEVGGLADIMTPRHPGGWRRNAWMCVVCDDNARMAQGEGVNHTCIELR